jgi:2-polyprenyl-3-methyl-5-hydroxy-6-metoxy-1,4-benzoquinol methylase
MSTDDWPIEAYDVVTVIDVMHHVPINRQHEFFVACARRVRAGGRLVYKDMCRSPAWRSVANRCHDVILAQQWINYVPIEQIEKWAKQESMKLSRREAIPMLWYGHELRVFEREPI